MKWGEKDIKGDVKAAGHEGWIELQSAQVGVSRNITSPSGRGTSREASVPAVQELVVTKLTDSASSNLFRASLWGEGKKVVIDFVKTGETEPYLTITLENTLVANYSVSGHGGVGHSKPMESLTLNFTSVQWGTAKSVQPHEGRAPTWDLATVKGT
jgi:type VI secretion system secreted protein Hcp